MTWAARGNAVAKHQNARMRQATARRKVGFMFIYLLQSKKLNRTPKILSLQSFHQPRPLTARFAFLCDMFALVVYVILTRIASHLPGNDVHWQWPSNDRHNSWLRRANWLEKHASHSQHPSTQFAYGNAGVWLQVPATVLHRMICVPQGVTGWLGVPLS